MFHSDSDEKEKVLFLESINSDTYDNAKSFSKHKIYEPVAFNVPIQNMYNTSNKINSFFSNQSNSNIGSLKNKCNFYNKEVNDMSTFTNSATLLINAENSTNKTNKTSNGDQIHSNALYSQVFIEY